MFASRIGGGPVEGDRNNGPGRVAAHARQAAKLGDVARKPAAMALDDQPGRLVKLPRAAVIAQSFPQPQHFFNSRGGQGLDIGQRAKKTLEVRRHRRRLRLLEHDLAQPDRVGIAAGPPPGQIAGVPRVPRPQATAKGPLPRGVGQRRSQVGASPGRGSAKKTDSPPSYGSLMPWNS